MLLLVSPSETEKFLARGATPIAMLFRLAMVINGKIVPPVRDFVVECADIDGIILRDYSTRVKSSRACNMKCGRNLWNRQQDNVSKHVCYQVPNRNVKFIVAAEVEVTLEDRTSFSTIIRIKWGFGETCFHITASCWNPSNIFRRLCSRISTFHVSWKRDKFYQQHLQFSHNRFDQAWWGARSRRRPTEKWLDSQCRKSDGSIWYIKSPHHKIRANVPWNSRLNYLKQNEVWRGWCFSVKWLIFASIIITILWNCIVFYRNVNYLLNDYYYHCCHFVINTTLYF